MHRVLLISEYFPPRNSVASYRSGAFAKYLVQFGWEPTVLTLEWNEADGPYDPEFVPNIPTNLEVVSVPAIPPAKRPNVLSRKLSTMLYASRTPQYWWRPARAALDDLLNRKRFDAIWASSPPLGAMTLGAFAASRQNIPWVADIRDCLQNTRLLTTLLGRYFYVATEKRLVASADTVVCVTDAMRKYFSTFAKTPVIVIPNGFDPDLMEAGTAKPAQKFSIIYAGSLHPGHITPDRFIEALHLLRHHHLHVISDFRVTFYGMSLEQFRLACSGSIEDLPVEVFPRIPHKEALRALKSSTVLLQICHPKDRGIMTGKIFDYLMVGRPILAVPSDNDCVAELIARTRTGVALSDPREIASKLVEWHSEWKKNGFLGIQPDQGEIQKYSRKEQAKELAAILNQLKNGNLFKKQ